MNTATQIIVTVISSGIGAGVVTFALNTIKAERDFLRSKLEELYLAVHNYTVLMISLSELLLQSEFELLRKKAEERNTGNVDRLVVLIDLYFPQLRPQFDEFTSLLRETLILADDELNLSDPEHKAKCRRIRDEARKFEKAIAEVSRSHSLLSWTY